MTLGVAVVTTCVFVTGLLLEASANTDLVPRSLEVILWLASVTAWVSHVGVWLTGTVTRRFDRLVERIETTHNDLKQYLDSAIGQVAQESALDARRDAMREAARTGRVAALHSVDN